MNILFFDTHEFEKPYFEQSFKETGTQIEFLSVRLNDKTASLCKDHEVICCFVHDKITESIAKALAQSGVKLILLRSAGFNNVDLKACKEFGLKVCRVPEYSPYSVAEYTVALLQTLNRKINRAITRVRELNFSLDHLVGFDLHGKTVGVIGTGKIGAQVAKIFSGYGCRVLAYDKFPNEDIKSLVEFVELDQLLSQSKVISLHVPLTPDTKYLLDKSAFEKMQAGAVVINTGRGALIDTKALIAALKSGHLGGAALDVYEEEENLFFADHSFEVLEDDALARLLTFPNVVVTAHQAFLTNEALLGISNTTLQSYLQYQNQDDLKFEIAWK